MAKSLALARARVLLLSRKAENGEEAVTEIKKLARESEGSFEVDIQFIEIDLGNMKNVKEVADKIAKDENRLDIVRISIRIAFYYLLNALPSWSEMRVLV